MNKRNAKNNQSSKKIDVLNPKKVFATKKADETKPTEAAPAKKAKKVHASVAIEGAVILKQISAKLALIEREIVIPGTTLKIRVRLFHAAVDGKVFEAPERKKANEWLKANAPAGAKKSGGKGKGVIVKLMGARKALVRAMDMLEKAASAKGVTDVTKKEIAEAHKGIMEAYTRVTVQAKELNVALLPAK